MAGKLENLRSWVSRTDFDRIEIIIVHDLQDLLTGAELNNLVIGQPKIKLIERTFNSAGLARNAGIKIAKGKYIFFWDSDDDPNIDIVNNFRKGYESTNTDVFVFQFNKVNRKKLENNVLSKNWKQVLVNPGLWRILISRNLIAGSAFQSLSMGEDQVFLAQLSPWQHRTEFLPQFIYNYNVGNPNQATSSILAISQLPKALKLISEKMNSSLIADQAFLSIMYWRQFFTCICRGSSQAKILSLGSCLTTLSALRFNRLIIHLKSLMWLLWQIK
jgi:hypothetical protein